MYTSAAISALNTVTLSLAGYDPPEWFVKLFLVGVALVAVLALFRLARDVTVR